MIGIAIIEMFPHSQMRNRYMAAFCAFAPIAYLLVFFIVPLLMIAVLSVSGSDPLESYRRILTTSIYSRVMLDTFSVSLWVTLICLVGAYPMAYCMTRLGSRTVGIVIAILVLPWWTSVLVRSYAWIVILSPTGLINTTLMQLGLTQTPLPLLYNTFGVIVGTAHVLFPFAVLPIYTVMQRIDRRLLLAAQSLGAGGVSSLLYVLVPLSLPGIFAAAIIVFVQALGFFVTPAVLGGGRTIVVSMLIESQVNEALNWKLASALGMILLVVTLVLLLAYQKITRVERTVMVAR